MHHLISIVILIHLQLTFSFSTALFLIENDEKKNDKRFGQIDDAINTNDDEFSTNLNRKRAKLFYDKEGTRNYDYFIIY